MLYTVYMSKETNGTRKAIFVPEALHKTIKSNAQKNGRTMVGELTIRFQK